MSKQNKCEHPDLKPKKGLCSKELQINCHGKVCDSPDDIPESGVCSTEQCSKCHGTE